MPLLHNNEGDLWLLIMIQCIRSLEKKKIVVLPNGLIKYDIGKHYLL